MDMKLVFAVMALVLSIVWFFLNIKWLKGDLNGLIEKGILYNSVTMKRYLDGIVSSSIFVLCFIVTVVCLIFYNNFKLS